MGGSRETQQEWAWMPSRKELLGMSSGDKKELKADFPKDFDVGPLAGKSVCLLT